ncbi:MAG: sugar phosphate isomerase/epimerase [Sedimentisphaerales bacterium]|nr:sugar phosphate isomerase/epimerase [Sedimentisphaerales bacterium]
MNGTNRRTFIKSSMVASAGVILPNPTGTQAKPSQNPIHIPLRIGLMTYNLARNWDIETIIANCTKAQFEHVELRTTHAHKVEVNLTKAQRGEVKKRFEDSPIRAISFASGFSYHHGDPAVLKRNTEGTKEYILLAQDVGVKGIRVFPNQIPVEGVPVEKTLEQIGRTCREIATFGADHGVQIRIANHGRGTNRLKITRKILDYADCTHLYVNFNCDPTDTEEPGFESNFNLVRGRIGNVHMHQLFHETYPYRRLFQLLKESRYEGYCNAEIPESCEPIRLMQYYRALFLAYQNVI